jgi:hypothetical protein
MKHLGLTETARERTGAGYRMVWTTFQSSTSYTLTIISSPPVNTLPFVPSNVTEVTVFW